LIPCSDAAFPATEIICIGVNLWPNSLKNQPKAS
jgi:hypothetical protein